MKDLRAFIAEFSEKLPNESVKVSREVDPKYEVSAIIKKLDLMGKHPLVVFENVKGSDMSVVCNTDAARSQFSIALGASPEMLDDFYAEREEECILFNKYPIKEIDQSQAFCKEMVKIGKDANLYDFPFLNHHEEEAPYLTRAIGIVNDERAGCPHTAHYRLMIKKPDLGVTHATPGRHLWRSGNEKPIRANPLKSPLPWGSTPEWRWPLKAVFHTPPRSLMSPVVS